MHIEFDPEKRDKTIAMRGLDFARAGEAFAGRHFTAPDLRENYGEPRFVTVGKWIVVWLLWYGHHAAQHAASSV